MECFVCGTEAATGFHMDPFLCSGKCYGKAVESYVKFAPSDTIREWFPFLQGINTHAEHFGDCRGEYWEEVLAHAHTEAGYICVGGPVTELFDGRGSPTSLFLHECAPTGAWRAIQRTSGL